ncbi:TPA: oligosaccharide repeat unit polymerase [Vibrio vulnificus]|nr:oligosaccharide repeat unit polymerase [Vibrio vulnificus]
MRYIFITYLLILLCGVFYRYTKIKSERLSLEKFIYLVFSFFYLVIPILYLSSFDSLKKNTYNFWVLETNLDFIAVFYAICIYSIFVFGSFCGFYSGRRIRIVYNIYQPKHINIFLFFILALAILSSCLTFFYAYKVGGIDVAIIEANSFRGHGEREPPIGQLAKFQPFITTCALLLIAFRSRFRYFFVLIAMLYLLFEASRSNIGMFFIIIYFYHLNKKGNFKISSLMVPGCIAIFMAVLGNAVTDYIYSGSWSVNGKAFYSFVSQFSPTFSTALNVSYFTDEYGFGYLKDAVSIFPQSFFGIEKTVKTWEKLTEYYLGGFYTVGIPIDIMSYSYSQFGFLGSFIMPFLYFAFFGFLSKKFDVIIQHSTGKTHSVALMMELICCAFVMSLISWASIDSTVFYGTIKYWVVLFVFLFIPKFRLYKK